MSADEPSVATPEPTCKECGAPLETDILKIEELSVFCPNEECDYFAQSFWIER